MNLEEQIYDIIFDEFDSIDYEELESATQRAVDRIWELLNGDLDG